MFEGTALTEGQKDRVLVLFLKGQLTAEEVTELDRLWRIVEEGRNR